MKTSAPPIYGVMAEFDNPTDVVHAAERVYEEGYRQIDAYSPYPIEELSEAIGFHTNRVPLVVLIGGVLGASGGAALCYWVSTTAYALNIGGRPRMAGSMSTHRVIGGMVSSRGSSCGSTRWRLLVLVMRVLRRRLLRDLGDVARLGQAWSVPWPA